MPHHSWRRSTMATRARLSNSEQPSRVVLSKHMTGNTLQRVHQIGDSNLGRILHQQINVMVFAVYLDEFALEVDTKPSKTAIAVG